MDITPAPWPNAGSPPPPGHEPLFDWENLRFFLGLYNHRSLVAAARSLRVEHATVARRIAALEQSLSLRLVDRRSRKYELTDTGKRIALAGLGMQAQATAVSLAANRLLNTGASLTLSAPPSLASHLLAPQLGRLRREHPHLELRVLASAEVPDLASREADVVLRWGRPEALELVARKAGSCHFAWFAAAEYLQQHPAGHYRFIAYEQYESAAAQHPELALAAQRQPIALRASSVDILANAAQSGAGVALLPRFIGEQPAYGLQTVALPSGALQVELWLAVHEDLRHAPGVKELMAFVVSCCSALGSDHG